MSAVKRNCNINGMKKRGQAWYVATQLHSDLIVEVDDVIFHLQKFPLLCRSGLLNKLIFESRDTEKDHIKVRDLPGGPETFELAAKFCLGSISVNITPRNVAALRCAAEYLQMTEDLEEGNLISRTESYLSNVVLASWLDSITVLQCCARLSPWAENLNIVQRCIESIAWKASTDPARARWPFTRKDESYLISTCNRNRRHGRKRTEIMQNAEQKDTNDQDSTSIFLSQNCTDKHHQVDSIQATQVEIQSLRGEFNNLLNLCHFLQQQLDRISKQKSILPWKKLSKLKLPFLSSVIVEGEDRESVKTDTNTFPSTSNIKGGRSGKPLKWRRNSI
eukprot:Gb_41063 [translate_table: standard]